jgi:hypothetical protein
MASPARTDCTGGGRENGRFPILGHTSRSSICWDEHGTHALLADQLRTGPVLRLPRERQVPLDL